MACRCPLIVSDIPSHREFLDGTTAALAPLSVAPFVDAVLDTLSNGPQVTSRQTAARRQVEDFSPARAVQQYDSIYREVVRRHD
jgi:glycosyltransferase involved in cell wall biosynthesis